MRTQYYFRLGNVSYVPCTTKTRRSSSKESIAGKLADLLDDSAAEVEGKIVS